VLGALAENIRPYSNIEKPMQCLSAFGKFSQVPLLQRLCERVKQTPDVPILEGRMQRFAPLFQHARDVAVRTYAHIDTANDEIMSLASSTVAAL